MIVRGRERTRVGVIRCLREIDVAWEDGLARPHGVGDAERHTTPALTQHRPRRLRHLVGSAHAQRAQQLALRLGGWCGTGGDERKGAGDGERADQHHATSSAHRRHLREERHAESGKPADGLFIALRHQFQFQMQLLVELFKAGVNRKDTEKEKKTRKKTQRETQSSQRAAARAN